MGPPRCWDRKRGAWQGAQLEPGASIAWPHRELGWWKIVAGQELGPALLLPALLLGRKTSGEGVAWRGGVAVVGPSSHGYGGGPLGSRPSFADWDMLGAPEGLGLGSVGLSCFPLSPPLCASVSPSTERLCWGGVGVMEGEGVKHARAGAVPGAARGTHLTVSIPTRNPCPLSVPPRDTGDLCPLAQWRSGVTLPRSGRVAVAAGAVTSGAGAAPVASPSVPREDGGNPRVHTAGGTGVPLASTSPPQSPEPRRGAGGEWHVPARVILLLWAAARATVPTVNE